MDSLLVALQKYPKRDNYSPDENFLTEAFAWLLRNHAEANQAFVELIKVDRRVADEIEWKTQHHVQSSFIDLYGKASNGKRLIVEIKINAALGQDQIENYRKAIVKEQRVNDKDIKTVLITRSRLQHTEKCDCSLTWSQVYQTFDKLRQDQDPKDNDKDRYCIEEFLALLEYHGMQPFEPIDTDVLAMASAYPKLYKQIHAELKSLRNAESLSELKFGENDSLKCSSDTAWGRLGLRWQANNEHTNWKPGLFCGLLVDPTDHECGWLSENETMMCLIVSIGKNYWKSLELQENAEAWKLFVKALRDEYKKAGWKVYDAAHDHGHHAWNQWHRLIIWMPVSDWLNAKEHEQIDIDKLMIRFEVTAKDFLGTLQELEELETLLENLAH